MRVLVTGSRKWRDRALLYEVLDGWRDLSGIDVLIEGCAAGADRMAEQWAAERGVPVVHVPAEWDLYGKAAGPRRNSRMLREWFPNVVLAFHEDIRNSAGTGDMVHKAERAGVQVVLTEARIPA